MSDHEERKAAEAAQMASKMRGLLSTPQLHEQLKILAQYRRQRYLALVAAGFDPGQALYLCHQSD